MQSIGQILDLRKEVIVQRQSREKEMLKEMLIQERISPRSFTQKQNEIAEWGEKEKAFIDQSKSALKEGWNRAYEAIQKTQQDLKFLMKKGEKRVVHLSQSQSQLLRCQLNELKSHLSRNLNDTQPAAGVSLNSSQSEIKPVMEEKKDNKENQAIIKTVIQSVEDIPLNFEQVHKLEPMVPFRRVVEQHQEKENAGGIDLQPICQSRSDE